MTHDPSQSFNSFMNNQKIPYPHNIGILMHLGHNIHHNQHRIISGHKGGEFFYWKLSTTSYSTIPSTTKSTTSTDNNNCNLSASSPQPRPQLPVQPTPNPTIKKLNPLTLLSCLVFHLAQFPLLTVKESI
jgi:hypothetical protein